MARKSLKLRVKEYCRQNGCFDEGDTVLIGVSGGADSVCLFLLLSELGKEYSLKIHTICVDHGLRKEAAAECAYVRELSEKHGAVFHTGRIETETYAKSKHLSVEEAARDLRYEAFLKCADEIGAAKIAVAHTRDDQAETVLYRLFRGSGLKGLGGMHAVSGRLIRPLLAVSREEIEAELLIRGVAYHTDPTNASDDYARNYIRHHILPASREVNEQAPAHIAEAAERLSAAEDFFEDLLRREYTACVKEMPAAVSDEENADPVKEKQPRIECVQIGRAGFLMLHPYLQERLLMLVLERLCGKARDIGAVHITDLKGLFTLPTGKRLDLPYCMTAVRRRTFVEIFAPDRAPFYKKRG